MSYDGNRAAETFERQPDLKSERLKPDPSYVADLIGVLLPQPAGLRRWSVMRAIRQRREKAHQPVPHKFEDKVERAFRGFCAEDLLRNGNGPCELALFYRPKEKAGEVWAVNADAARAWLDSEFPGRSYV